MIKRIAVALALVLLPLAAMAEAPDRDLLLTNDGTLYAAESMFAQNAPGIVQTSSTRVLTLTVQNGSSTRSTTVPASLSGGWHVNPALAFDNDSKTLFIFWESVQQGGLASSLLFCSYQDGRWSEPTALDNADWDLRHNLRIAVTRHVESVDKAGKVTSVPGLTVHAVWWQENGYAQWARYAMITIEKGNVASSDIPLFNLNTFTPSSHGNGNGNGGPAKTAQELLRHPAIFESAGHDTVDIVFGDVDTKSLHRLTIKPSFQVKDDGRIRIPIGVKNPEIGAPEAISLDASFPVSALSTGSDNVVYYFGTTQALSYVMYKDGRWSAMRSIALNDRVTRDTAVDAIRRMVSAE
jgi:hypothetical protein